MLTHKSTEVNSEKRLEIRGFREFWSKLNNLHPNEPPVRRK